MKIQQTKSTIINLLLSTVLLASGAAAQPAQSEPANSPSEINRASQEPTVRTYDKFPDPSGREQDLDAIDYDSEPYKDKTPFTRFEEQNDANDGERYEPTITPIEDTVRDDQ